MRMSTLFGRTLREAPADAEGRALQLALRAGLLRPLLPGGYALLPLGMLALRRVEAIVRAEIERLGAQELRTPIVQPAELWAQAGRAAGYGEALLRLGARGLVAPDHLAAVVELARREIGSYRQLPALVYQAQTVYRDEPRVRRGLVELRESTQFSVVSLDADEAGLEGAFAQVAGAVERALARCGLTVRIAESGDAAGYGAGLAYQAPAPAGDEPVFACPACGYRAAARFATAALPEAVADPSPLEAVETPACPTIAALAAFLGVPESATAKAVFFDTPERGLVFAVIRGDRDIDPDKLRAAAGVSQLRPASVEQIVASGAVPGYASPVGLSVQAAEGGGRAEAGKAPVFVIADRSAATAAPLVAGANREGYHLRGVVYGRDWRASIVADIALAREGDPCPRCGAALALERAATLARLARLGPVAGAAFGATFLDRDGKPRPLALGHYTVELEALLQAIVEQHSGEAGIAWPASVAPCDLHLVRLGKKPELHAAADALYAELAGIGLAVLYDDRDESPGVKFNDADLIGLPWRLLIGDRLLAEGALELRRRGDEPEKLPREEAISRLQMTGNR